MVVAPARQVRSMSSASLDIEQCSRDSFFLLTRSSGKSYRLRFVNAAINTHFKFMLDNHTVTVISSDFIPVKPYDTKVVDIAIGQHLHPHNIRAIVHYGKQPSTPKTKGYPYEDKCQDEQDLSPWFVREARKPNITVPLTASLMKVGDEFKWFVNSTTFVSDWSDPTLLQLVDKVPSFKPSTNVIENLSPIPHPIHLHGHDFAVIAQATGNFSDEEAITALSRANPPRRDTATLPALGHIVMAIRTTNPGAWLMHCHIGWHTSEGFGLQILERAQDIPAVLDTERLRRECRDWKAYQNKFYVEQRDSGI
ncbi:multicopper oxidase [Ophiocordyceps camponoti-floridani]|uniref:Multicopper oxidase n=1 Tax=Ophiocordyceps camponoti-floridani TaxID=2030778 RepID=A0A8H4Q0X6_9HYPO|nr:multicopper oxidase [Ophiocordyceps camponoti-floridani]